VSKINLRQSDEWFEYLKSLNWRYVKTSSGVKIAYFKSLFGVVIKIQRPILIDKANLDEILNFALKNKAIIVKIEPSIGQDEDILLEAGFKVSKHPLSPPSTMFIDLTKSEEDLWKNVSRSGKYGVKRAHREGSRVGYFKNPKKQQLKDFFKLAKATGKRGKFYVQPFKELLTKAKIFKDDCYIISVFDNEGNLQGGKFFLGIGDTINFTMGGTTTLGRKGKGGYELMWKSILYLKKEGYRELDLEGVDDDRFPTFTRSWGGFSHFKEKFGGEVLRFPPPYVNVLSKTLRFCSRFIEPPF